MMGSESHKISDQDLAAARQQFAILPAGKIDPLAGFLNSWPKGGSNEFSLAEIWMHISMYIPDAAGLDYGQVGVKRYLLESPDLSLGGAAGRGRWAVAGHSTSGAYWLRMEAGPFQLQEDLNPRSETGQITSKGYSDTNQTAEGTSMSQGSAIELGDARFYLASISRSKPVADFGEKAGVGAAAMTFSSGRVGRSVHALLVPGLVSYICAQMRSRKDSPMLHRLRFLMCLLSAGLEATENDLPSTSNSSAAASASSGPESAAAPDLAHDRAARIRLEMDAALEAIAPGQGPWIHEELDGSIDGKYSPARPERVHAAESGAASSAAGAGAGAPGSSATTGGAASVPSEPAPSCGFAFGRSWMQSPAMQPEGAAWVGDVAKIHRASARMYGLEGDDEDPIVRRELEGGAWTGPGTACDPVGSTKTMDAWDKADLLRHAALWGCKVQKLPNGVSVLTLPGNLSTDPATRGMWRMRLAEMTAYTRAVLGSLDHKLAFARGQRLFHLEQAVRLQSMTDAAVDEEAKALPLLDDLDADEFQDQLLDGLSGMPVMSSPLTMNSLIVDRVLGGGLEGVLGEAAQVIGDNVKYEIAIRYHREEMMMQMLSGDATQYSSPDLVKYMPGAARFGCFLFCAQVLRQDRAGQQQLRVHAKTELELRNRAWEYAGGTAKGLFIDNDLHKALSAELEDSLSPRDTAGTARSTGLDRQASSLSLVLPATGAITKRYRARAIARVIAAGEKAYQEAISAHREQPDGDEERALKAKVQGTASVQIDASRKNSCGYNYSRQSADLVGLANVGNTCYANAALVAMLHTRSIRELVLSSEANLTDDVQRAKEAAVDEGRGPWGRRLARDYLRAASVLWELRKLFGLMLYGPRKTQLPSDVIVALAAVSAGNLNKIDSFDTFSNDAPRYAIAAARQARRRAQQSERAKIVREHRTMRGPAGGGLLRDRSEAQTPILLSRENSLGVAVAPNAQAGSPPVPPTDGVARARVGVLQRSSEAGAADGDGRIPVSTPPLKPNRSPSDGTDLPGLGDFGAASILAPAVVKRESSTKSATSATSWISDAEVQSLAGEEDEAGGPAGGGAGGNMRRFPSAGVDFSSHLGEVMVPGSVEWQEALAVEGHSSISNKLDLTRDGSVVAVEVEQGSSSGGAAAVAAGPAAASLPEDPIARNTLRYRHWRPLVAWKMGGDAADSGLGVDEEESDEDDDDGFVHGMPTRDDLLNAGGTIGFGLMAQDLNERHMKQKTMLTTAATTPPTYLQQSDAGEFQRFVLEVIEYAMRGFERVDAEGVRGKKGSPGDRSSGAAGTDAAAATAAGSYQSSTDNSLTHSQLAHRRLELRNDVETMMQSVALARDVTLPDGTVLPKATVLASAVSVQPRGTARWADPDGDWDPAREVDKFYVGHVRSVQDWPWLVVALAGSHSGEEAPWKLAADSGESSEPGDGNAKSSGGAAARGSTGAAAGDDSGVHPTASAGVSSSDAEERTPPPGYGLTRRFYQIAASVYSGIYQDLASDEGMDLSEMRRTLSDSDVVGAAVDAIRSTEGATTHRSLEAALTAVRDGRIEGATLSLSYICTPRVVQYRSIVSLPPTLTMVLGRQAPESLSKRVQLDYEIFMDDFVAPTDEYRRECTKYTGGSEGSGSGNSSAHHDATQAASGAGASAVPSGRAGLWSDDGRDAVRTAQRALAVHRATSKTVAKRKELQTAQQSLGAIQDEIMTLSLAMEQLDSMDSMQQSQVLKRSMEVVAEEKILRETVAALQSGSREGDAQEEALCRKVLQAYRAHARLVYRVRAVVIHDGPTYMAGHYYAYARLGGLSRADAREEDSTWVKYNDENVTPGVPWEKVVRDAEGQTGARRSYMVVYERVDQAGASGGDVAGAQASSTAEDSAVPVTDPVQLVGSPNSTLQAAMGLIREHIRQDPRCASALVAPPKPAFGVMPLFPEHNPMLSRSSGLLDLLPLLREEIKGSAILASRNMAYSVADWYYKSGGMGASRQYATQGAAAAFNRALRCTGDPVVAMLDQFDQKERDRQQALLASPLLGMTLQNDEWVSDHGTTLTEAVNQIGHALSAIVQPRSISEGSNMIVYEILTFSSPLARQKGARCLVAAREIANRLVQARAEAIAKQASRPRLDFLVDPGRILEPRIDDDARDAASARAGKASVLRLAGKACPSTGPDAVPEANLHMGLNCRSSYRTVAFAMKKHAILKEYPMTYSGVRAVAGKGTRSSREYIRESPNALRCYLEMHPDTSNTELMKQSEHKAYATAIPLSPVAYSSVKDAVRADRSEQLVVASCALREAAGVGREIIMLGPLIVPSLVLGPEACLDKRRYVDGTAAAELAYVGAPSTMRIGRLMRENGGGPHSRMVTKIKQLKGQGKLRDVDEADVPSGRQLSLAWCIVPESVVLQHYCVHCIDTSRVTALTEAQAIAVLGKDQYDSHKAVVARPANVATARGATAGMAALEGRRFQPIPEMMSLHTVLARQTGAAAGRTGAAASLAGHGIWLQSGSISTRIADVFGVPLAPETGYAGASLSLYEQPVFALGDVASDFAVARLPSGASLREQCRARNRTEVWHASMASSGCPPCFDAERLRFEYDTGVDSVTQDQQGTAEAAGSGSTPTLSIQEHVERVLARGRANDRAGMMAAIADVPESMQQIVAYKAFLLLSQHIYASYGGGGAAAGGAGLY